METADCKEVTGWSQPIRLSLSGSIKCLRRHKPFRLWCQSASNWTVCVRASGSCLESSSGVETSVNVSEGSWEGSPEGSAGVPIEGWGRIFPALWDKLSATGRTLFLCNLFCIYYHVLLFLLLSPVYVVLMKAYLIPNIFAFCLSWFWLTSYYLVFVNTSPLLPFYLSACRCLTPVQRSMGLSSLWSWAMSVGVNHSNKMENHGNCFRTCCWCLIKLRCEAVSENLLKRPTVDNSNQTELKRSHSEFSERLILWVKQWRYQFDLCVLHRSGYMFSVA